MSGGVDSTVAAFLLSKEGFEVIGITAKFLPDAYASESKQCCNADSAYAAERACDLIGAQHITLNLTDAFRESVVARFVEGYKRGATPNPCIDCNRFIKFELFFKYAEELNAEFLATGHYARIERDESGLMRLKKGVNSDKDQSYFLASIPYESLEKIKFPLGTLKKKDVRRIAAEIGFRNAERQESQDICFVSKDTDFARLIEIYELNVAHPLPGPIIDESGRVRGEHRGIEYFTLGQRRGFGVGMEEKKFVYAIDADLNSILVGPRYHFPVHHAELADCNWLARDLLLQSDEFEWRLRYRSEPIAAALKMQENGAAASKTVLTFAEPMYFVTPGQWAVAYLGDTVVGCGEITRAF